jgi:hypothetical protein
MKRLRLVKVVVHPIFVVDDGESLTEFQNTPSEIPASEWDGFSERLKADIATAETALNRESEARDAGE